MVGPPREPGHARLARKVGERCSSARCSSARCSSARCSSARCLRVCWRAVRRQERPV